MVRQNVGLSKQGPMKKAPISSPPAKGRIIRGRRIWLSANFALLFMIYRFLEVAEECASFNFVAHSSQHTSTVLPPILTLMEFPSSLQSQAAQVAVLMVLFSCPKCGQAQ